MSEVVAVIAFYAVRVRGFVAAVCIMAFLSAFVASYVADVECRLHLWVLHWETQLSWDVGILTLIIGVLTH